jgi:phenylalanyl-tRNA synthetase alpha chain
MSSSYLEKVAEVQSAFAQELSSLGSKIDARAVEDLRIAFLGKKGRVTALFEDMRNVSKEERPQAGKAVNDLRQGIEARIDELKGTAERASLDSLIDNKRVDISLPVIEPKGSLHPVTLMREALLREFRKLGFSVYDGPEVDLDFYNFSALNFPDEHPARDMQDTFFVKGLDKTVLRTHTSNIQIHAMLNERPPLRLVAPGRTFRCDSDQTHTPMFHQIEAVVVDHNISLADMKSVIDYFLKAIYGHDLKTRLRPSFFPFVEPGAEVDVQCVSCRGKGCRLCKETGWLEIGGCGMIHPNVFESVGYDSESYTGFAFGFGIDRMAMLKYNLPDLRMLFDGNQDFLKQFPRYAW